MLQAHSIFYGSQLWTCNDSELNRLRVAWNDAVRTICGVFRQCHVDTMLVSIGLLPLTKTTISSITYLVCKSCWLHFVSSRRMDGHSRPASTDLAPFASSIRARPHKRRSPQYKSAKVSTRPRTISLVPGHNWKILAAQNAA